jgi:N-acetyltransferase
LKVIWQPTLIAETLLAPPLKKSDYEKLYEAASDPNIWKLHPEFDRYTKHKFDLYFHSRLNSNGALLVTDKKSGEVIGCSRYSEHNETAKTVEIGSTFLKCARWGTGANLELKNLMLKHAFQFVDTVEFLVGASNFRSQAAMVI